MLLAHGPPTMRPNALLLAIATTPFSYLCCAAPPSEEAQDPVSAETLAMGTANTSGFKNIPDLTPEQRAAILDRYSSIHHEEIRPSLYEMAILYYDTNIDRIENKNFLSVVDFSKQ